MSTLVKSFSLYHSSKPPSCLVLQSKYKCTTLTSWQMRLVNTELDKSHKANKALSKNFILVSAYLPILNKKFLEIRSQIS